MLATAVALQPRHLVVAGVDLFNHPAGAYPGDAVTPNAYTAAHEPGTELALLLEALSLYEGDLTILSPAQIGRASCRDRVCQYVYISVFAVSLKKKQQYVKRYVQFVY